MVVSGVVKLLKVDDDWNLARSAFILAVSRRLVSENCVAMTTRHKLIMKNDPICSETNGTEYQDYILAEFTYHDK